MTLLIDYQSRSFPSYSFGSGTLKTSWDALLWAAITIGRPSTYHVFRYGPPSFHEAIFRLSLIRMAVEQDWNDHLRRTNAFAALDPTEKGMVSYFLGMALCKLFRIAPASHSVASAPGRLSPSAQFDNPRADRGPI